MATLPDQGALRGTVRCPYCNTLGYAGESFCSCCGKRLEERREAPATCPHCRAEIGRMIANYCPLCGKPLPKQSP